MKEKIAELFDSTGLDQILIFSRSAEQPYFQYFTSLPLNQFEGSALVLSKDRKPLVITNTLWKGLLEKNKEFNVAAAENRKAFIEILQKALPEKKVWANYHDFSTAGLSRLKRRLKGKNLANISRVLEKLRETKTKEEIRKIARAAKITEKALKIVPQLVKKGITERALAKRLEIEMLESDADTTAFPVIVASGSGGATPHYSPREKKICKGFLLVDCGARFENYCADLSRTFFVGRASEKEKGLYELVSDAKLAAEKKAVIGGRASETMKAVESSLAGQGFKMVHSLGHGIGLQDHDFPESINRKSNWHFRPGICFTLEPAVYGKFGGIRIEDDYLMERKRLKPFSRAPKELFEI
ncbi:MAG: Xaa-Pro peptidase family protein [Candidatus Diapherotrites archaeon]|nr:Xaa-Pro peptidase family protein [Candidatus Diapherotrites archaeon]